ncbi:26S proteasome non-ATPase regulatory subunit 4-like protein [Micractinium conductrix]|uniref:26S proteasome non-ATPase regulatory subunit 4 homolog n=1 Tax=Micractinium conductrix TaxID=554055 RepID=A0A2P6V8V7_9CHLO|nr:26S proteasome non-ATPase regulatory subunit 4-like protein [Micractinium conductrix]|eukprot:PSC70513.1 26S proteasome non-ATPase regulatory subunit 4-like protein [Micractinium conductrix]
MADCTVVCVDNSEFTRNGDYAPTRFQAQADAVNLLAGAKTQHHPENTVGVMTMAGKTPQVLVTPTPDLGKVLNAMQEMKIEGEVNLATAVQIAQLALKHRQNKNQRQRVVIFIGSPIAEDKDSLVKIAKKLKKNNVAVDIVSFGCEEENGEKLEAFHAAVNSNGNSHLVTVPPGTILSDMLFSTPIFMEEGSGGGGAAAAEGGAPAPRSNVVDGFDYGELGVDPTLDPELALALRVSMEEERARQAAAAVAAQQAGGEGGAAAEGAAGEAAAGAAAGGEAEGMAIDAMDEDALLQQALALSMQVDQAEQTTPAPAAAPAPTPAAPSKAAGEASAAAAAATPAATPAAAAGGEDQAMADLEVDDPELALALQMSLAEAQQPPKEEEKKE